MENRGKREENRQTWLWRKGAKWSRRRRSQDGKEALQACFHSLSLRRVGLFCEVFSLESRRIFRNSDGGATPTLRFRFVCQCGRASHFKPSERIEEGRSITKRTAEGG